jgi:hypothetical protein
MIKAIIPDNPEFWLYKDKLKEMYEQNQDKICDSNSFDFIINNTLFYCYVNSDGTLIGAIYFFVDDDGKLFLNAYAGRKHFNLNVECVKLSTKWFNCDIYAEAQNRASALCLLRAGFKRVKDKLFVYEQGRLPGKD